MKNAIFPLVCCSVLASRSLWASDLFMTLENSYKIINLQKAKADNPTIDGSGTVVGVVDSMFNTNHPSLKDKAIKIAGYQEFDKIYQSDADSIGLAKDNATFRHGTHVAGILLGKHLGRTTAFANDGDPYGVAPNAKFYGAAFKENSNFSFWGLNTFDFFSQDPNLKVINHSWGYKVFPYESKISSYDEALKVLEESNTFSGKQNKAEVENIVKLAKERKVLNVFGSGNDGKDSASLFELLPRYDEEIRSFIAVGMLDTDGIDIAENGEIIIRDKRVNELSSGGTRILALQGIHKYSNGFLGSQAYSLMAPGSRIDSANALFEIDTKLGREKQEMFVPLTGTSQAAPMVSGAAALVAQKYPFLNGKQIADVLLSTANQNYRLPKVIIKQKPGYDAFSVIYIDQDVPTDPTQIKKDLEELGYTDQPNNEKITVKKILSSNKFYRLNREDLMGQGILDIQKALKGIAILDANRLNLSDIQNLTGKEEAYYLIDTQGKNGEFSNNISQKQWDDRLHLATAKNSPADKIRHLDVGFIKAGDGQLAFSGTNSYKGATVVRGGELHLKNGSTLTDSNVFVESAGTLTGSGTIANDLDNKGTVIAGSDDLSTLNVGNRYIHHDTANLVLNFNTKGNSKLVAKNYEIKGGKLRYRPLQGEFYAAGQKVQIDLGDLSHHLNQFASVDIMSNGSAEFKLEDFKLAKDLTTINDDKVETEETTTTVETEQPTTEPKPTEPVKTEESSDTVIVEQPTAEPKPTEPVKTEESSDTVAVEQPTAEPKPTEPVKTEESSETVIVEPPTAEPKPTEPVKTEESSDTVIVEQPTAEPKPTEPVKTEESSETVAVEQPTAESKPTEPVKMEESSETVAVEQPTAEPKPTEPVKTEESSETVTVEQPIAEPKPTEPVKAEESSEAVVIEQPKENIIIAEVNIKKDAYHIPNSDMGETIYSVRTASNLNQAYQTFFAQFDSSTAKAEILNSLVQDNQSELLSDKIIKTAHFVQQNMLFAIKPHNLTAYRLSGIKKWASGDDKTLSSLVPEPKYAFYLSPSYKRTKAKNFNGHGYGFNMGLATAIGETQQLALGVNYEKSREHFNLARSRSHYLNVALNHLVQLEHFKLVNGISLAGAKNHYTRELLGESYKLNGSYRNLFLTAQTGIVKEYKVGHLTLSPLAYAQYDFIHQKAFDESGAIFAKKFQQINHHSMALAGGVIFNYATQFAHSLAEFDAYAIYQQRVSGKNRDSRARFKDFAENDFSQPYLLNRHLLTLGVNAQLTYKNGISTAITLASERTNKYKRFSVLATLGYKF
ncbi:MULTISPECIES: S8 family serine peptidase [Glaesserella]|uniref:Autotransporter domain-containing protein n=1 Tax=Glaesserella australis TaxID=2094024 RepID=A0A328C0P3_9PAST|nr:MULTISPECIES: S8 family serine peptidase [Glaesserella]AUI65134.1 hypothetical protein CJD39_00440 [Glaesserella sp. 15-184]RAL18044.1 hypothetical protein C5N92_09165 [Glaesserella australis]